MAAILAEYNLKAIRAAVRLKKTADNGLNALQQLLIKYRKAEYIQSNAGSELSAKHLLYWQNVSIQPLQECPGSLWETRYKERFKGKPQTRSSHC
jgi:hypothetical protein